jgi:hypothetical protein
MNEGTALKIEHFSEEEHLLRIEHLLKQKDSSWSKNIEFPTQLANFVSSFDRPQRTIEIPEISTLFQ